MSHLRSIPMRRAPIISNMARVWLALCGAALQLAAQDDPTSLLQRVRTHMVDTLARQPNYTCLETVERSNRAGKEKEFRLLDTVRLEVALVTGEKCSPGRGPKQFEDTDLRAFVPTGMFGNGDFGLYANSVFGGRLTEFEYKGEAKLGERSTTRYDFRVPAAAGMRIRALDLTATVGFHGSFYTEAGTLDALRLKVEADALPEKLGSSPGLPTRWSTSGRGSAAGIFLLPSASEAVMVSFAGRREPEHGAILGLPRVHG